MPLLLGQPITAKDIEAATSTWDAEAFARLCNAIVCAVTRLSPELTERVNVRDNGIDADLPVHFTNPGDPVPAPFLAAGRNVLQYKKREVAAQHGRSSVISTLKSKVKGALAQIEPEKGQTLDGYVLFVNLDLSRRQHLALKEAIADGCAAADKVRVEIIGAAELAAQLNNLPHLRAAFFSPEEFATWQKAWERHRRGKLFGANVALIGREMDVDRLKKLVDDEKVRAIVITGPHDIGKSRLVLEATRHRLADVAVGLDPISTTPADLLRLASPKSGTIVIVEDIEPDDVTHFVENALVEEKIKLIVTLPMQDEATLQGYGRDERVQVLYVGPLASPHAEALLRQARPGLDYSLESWILQQAQGNPGIILVAASIAEDLRAGSGKFREDVGRATWRRAQRALLADTSEALRPLCILTHVGVRGERRNEVEAICRVFGYALPTEDALGELDDAGLLKRGGSFAEVLPPILGSYLAEQELTSSPGKVLAVFAKLKSAARIRLITRLAQLDQAKASAIWDLFFGQQGLFVDLRSILDNMRLLREVSHAVPQRVASLLGRELSGLSIGERREIAGDQRRELVWTVEALVFRSETCEDGLRLLLLLGEAENEDYGNNASGVFCECFHYSHPQIPLSLSERLGLLKEFTGPDRSDEARRLAAMAIDSATESHACFMLRSSHSVQPLSRPLPMTYGDVSKYVMSLLELLMDLAQCGREAVERQALSLLPRFAMKCAMDSFADVGKVLDTFEALVGWSRDGKAGLEVGDLADELGFLIGQFPEKYEDIHGEKEGKDKAIERLKQLKSKIDTGNFCFRLKRWAGRRILDDDLDAVSQKDRKRCRFHMELDALAREAVENPSQLTDDLLTWLRSQEAQKSGHFFASLGAQDKDNVWQDKIERLADEKEGGVSAFAAYFDGLAKQGAEWVAQRLDELAKRQEFSGKAILLATHYMGADEPGLKRVLRLIEEGRVDRGSAGWLLATRGWIEPLSDEMFLRLIRAVAGPRLRNTSGAIDMLGMWLHIADAKQSPRKFTGDIGEFVRQCLETGGTEPRPNDEWGYDQVAARLAADNPEQGFALLQKRLNASRRGRGWNPVGLLGPHAFWNKLVEMDRRRAVRTVLDAYVTSGSAVFARSWSVRGLMNQNEDREVLLDLARKDEHTAVLVCGLLKPGRPGFADIADAILSLYPNSVRIEDMLCPSMVHEDGVMVGSQVPYLEGRRARLEDLLSKNPQMSPKLRGIIKKAIDALKYDSAQQAVWEYDINVDDLRGYIEKRDSPERIWAIGRLLTHAPWEAVQRMLSVEDIAEVIDEVDIPEKERQKIKKLLEVWGHGR